MPDIDLTSLCTTIGGVLGIPAAALDKLNFYDNLKRRTPLCITTDKYLIYPLPDGGSR